MNKQELAGRIVNAVGGNENITYFTHCITRLRFNILDESRVDKKTLESLDGVMGITKQGDQLQVIVGTGVEQIYNEAALLLNCSVETAKEEKPKFSVKLILETLTAIISPIIPAFCAAGMMKCICLLLTTFGMVDSTGGTYLVFEFISDIAFYFLPFLIAWSSAKRFKVDEGLAICVAGALLYPSFMSMVDAGTAVTFLGMSVPLYSYASTIFPTLLGVLFLSVVHRLVDRIIKWDAVKLLLVPLISLGITIPVTYMIVAPLGNWGASLLASAFSWLLDTIGPFAGLIIGFLMPIMTLTGLHQSLSPIELMEVTTYGFTFLLSIEFLHNMAEAGAAFGTALTTKDKKFKAIAAETGFTAFIGISEPALYTVTVKNRNAMISAMAGNGIGGFFSVLLGVKYFGFIWPNLFSIPNALGGDNPVGNVVRLMICAVITFGVSFSLPFILTRVGKKKEMEKEREKDQEKEMEQTSAVIDVNSPVSGMIIPLSQVKDETFSKGICGNGVGIIPENGVAAAPCDGEVMAAMHHAVGLRAVNGAELLVHVGIDTVELDGNGLTEVVKAGDHVKTGDPLIRFEKEELIKKGYDMTCIVVRSDGDICDIRTGGTVRAGEKVFRCS